MFAPSGLYCIKWVVYLQGRHFDHLFSRFTESSESAGGWQQLVKIYQGLFA